MIETDNTSLVGRAGDAGAKRGFSLDGTRRADGTDLRPTLMWLAGAGYKPLANRSKVLRPTSRHEEAEADRILAATKPDDPVTAADLRADLLVDLRRHAPNDPRTQAIFEADPIVVADLDTGWLVTESIFAARIGLFDSLNTLLQKPYLTDSACADLRRTLSMAFADLSDDAQREWCHSEVRLEQGLAFLESRAPSDLIALAEELRPIDAKRGIWDAMRLFSHAAQMSGVGGTATSPIASLLALKDKRQVA
jgi:hypothetical protein